MLRKRWAADKSPMVGALYGVALALAGAAVRVALVPLLGVQTPFSVNAIAVLFGVVLRGWVAGAVAVVVGIGVTGPALFGSRWGADAFGSAISAAATQITIVVVLFFYQRRVDADTARAESAEAQLHDALESTTDSIFVLDADWRFTYLNSHAVTQIAAGRALVGESIWESFPEAIGGPLYAAYQTCMRQRIQTQADQFYMPLDRHFTARAFPTAAGGITVFFRDVTDERAAAARLVEVEATLRTMGEAIPDLLYAKDRAGRMVYCNPATLAVVGRPLEEVLGRTDAEWLADREQGERVVRIDQAVMAAGQTTTVEEAVTDARFGEVRIWQSVKTPLRHPETGEVTGLVGVSRDVTDLRRTGDALEARVAAAVAAREVAQGQLAQAEKLTALGQLAGGIAHDMNNVLQAVLGATAMIERRSDEPQAVARLAGMAAEAATRGASLTRRLLSFSRRGELRRETVEPAKLVASLREVFEHTLGADIRIEVAIDDTLPALTADRGALEAALINLATNARDAMPDGGRLALSARHDIIDGTRYVAFAVEDSGTGIDPEILPRIFEPFFTTKAQDKGTGLGLPMVRSFAQQSGGSLDLDSSPGRGTRAVLRLPVDTVAADNTAAPAAARRHAGRVLLVDDEFLVRQVLAEQLRHAGFDVVEAEDGTTALALIGGGEAFDVLVSDRSMPGIDGVTLITRVRAERPALPAVLLTGFAGGSGAPAVTADYTVLRKPIAADELAARLAGLIGNLDTATGGA